jgi:hypothetical protein
MNPPDPKGFVAPKPALSRKQIVIVALVAAAWAGWASIAPAWFASWLIVIGFIAGPIILLKQLNFWHGPRFFVAGPILMFLLVGAASLIPGAPEWFGSHLGSVFGQVGRMLFH